MGLINIIQILANVGIEEAPFNDTIPFGYDNIIDNAPDYVFLGNYIKNPSSDSVLHFFSYSNTHFFEVGKKFQGKLSLDRFKTIPSTFDIYLPPTGYGTYSMNGGYDSNNRLHFFICNRDNNDISIADMQFMYAYSDDNATTISSPQSILEPSDGLLGSWATGRMIENNGVLLKNIYRQTSGGANSANYCLRSTDGGLNWAWITIRPSGAEYYNEGDIIAISSTELITLIRDEVNKGFQQYYSDDNGLTWVSQGNVSFGDSWGTQATPATLRSFRIKNQLVIACYYYLRNSYELKVIYGKASNLSNGVSGWDNNTKILLSTLTISGTDRSGYQNVVHYNNSLTASGVVYRDDPATEDTQTYYFTLPTTQYQNLITELGL